jgi:hypothetical protein
VYGFGGLWLWCFRFCRDARLFLNGCGAVRTAQLAPLAACRASEDLAQLLRHVVVDRARVRLLLGNAQLRKLVQQFVSFDFQLPGQYVNANLVHKKSDLSYF